MRRFLFIIIYFIQFLSIFSAHRLEAQFWTDRTKNYKAVFNTPEYDLGKVKAGVEYRFRVAFKNTGDAYLQVQEINIDPKTSAHKLSFIPPKGAILPEDSGAIEMIFVPADAADSFKYSATIVFNNSYRQVLKIKGITQPKEKEYENSRKGPLVFFENNFCDLDKLQRGVRNNCSFKLRNIGDEPLLIKSVKPNSDSIIVDFPKYYILPGKEAEINAFFEAEGYGSFRRYLNVETNMKAAEPILLIIKGKLPSRK